MGRSYGKYYAHWRIGDTGEIHYGKPVPKLLCGQNGLVARIARTEDEVGCPKCSELLGQQRLEHMKAEGTEVTFIKVDTKKYDEWRSKYKVVINGVPRAYIACKAGWSGGWRILDAFNEPLRQSLISKSWGAAESVKIVAEKQLPNLDEAVADRERKRAERFDRIKKITADQEEERLANRKKLDEAIRALHRACDANPNDPGLYDARHLLETLKQHGEINL